MSPIAAEVGGQRAGQRRLAFGIAGQEPCPGIRDDARTGGGERVVDLRDERVGKLHRLLLRERAQAVGEIGIAGRQRRPDGGGIVVRREPL